MVKKDKLIQLNNVSFTYAENNISVLNDVSVEINVGDFVGIIGRNGSGKSTLLKVFLKLIKPQKGEVLVFNDRKIGYVEQITNSTERFIPASVKEIVLLGLCGKMGACSWFSKAHKAMAQTAIDMVGLGGYENRLISKLSGGQQQKIAIAKALVSNPDLLILDEPTTGIDSETEHEFMKLLQHLNEVHKKTIVLVTHDTEKLKPTNRVLELKEGKLTEVKDV